MGENTRKDRRTKVLSMTVRYRSATLGEFIEHHSYDVSRGGMFIKTPSPFPPGTLLKFEVKIADEQRVMQGVGRVVWKRDQDGDSSNDPAGMGIKFIKIDDASRAVIDKLVEGRAPGQEGAFEHLPDAKPRMFPSTPPAQPAPEDRTVIKPASELLKDALKITGEESSPATRVSNLSPSSDESIVRSLDAAGEGERETEAPPSVKEKARKRADSTTRASQQRVRENPPQRKSAQSSHRDEEDGRGRAFLSILVALVVAAGIYFVTKQGSKEAPPPPTPVEAVAPEPPPAEDPVLPTPEPEPEPAL